MSDEFDAIVVGSGAAGSWAAKVLTEGDARVAVLEAGRAIDLERDFNAPKQRPATVVYRLRATLRGQHIQARCSRFSECTRSFFVNDRENPYSTPRGKPFLWYRGRQVGGRLHTWARHAPRFSESSFQPPDDETGGDRRWPLRYEDLAPYYDRIERTLGIFGRKDGIANLPDGEFVEPPPLSSLEEEFCRRLRVNLPFLQMTLARNVRHNQARVPLPLLHAQSTGRMSLQTDAVVSHILTDSNTGRAKGVMVVDRRTRKQREVLGRVVVLCASALETVRILLNSQNATHPHGVGGGSGVLGRYISDHVGSAWGGEVKSDLAEFELPEKEVADAYDWAPTSLYIPSFCERQRSRGFIGGYGIQMGFIRSRSSSGEPKVAWWMAGFGEMLPRYENCITLNRTRTDAWGIPSAHIECAYSDNEIRMFRHMQESVREIGDKTGLEAGNILASSWFGRALATLLTPKFATSFGAWHPGASIHEAGGARMGESAKNSVVNKFGQCWECDNVFVADSACFPSLSFPNHTLTIMALAARCCDFILREYKNEPREASPLKRT